MLRSLARNWVRQSVMRKGVRGDSTFWLVVGALGLLRSLQTRHARPHESVVLRERIRPGETLELHLPPERHRRRRRPKGSTT